MNIIPKPQKIISSGGVITVLSLCFHAQCEYTEFLKENLGVPFEKNEESLCLLCIKDEKAISDNFSPNRRNDAYILTLKKGNITLCYGSYSGFLNGAAALKQLFMKFTVEESKASLEECIIYDSPKYSYRGLLVDCARHFVPIDELKKTIKMMWLYKLNYLHLHLTDDQGWRIEIKKYPLLTEKGSVRSETQLNLKGSTDGREYGKGLFYTQDELRELVDFAHCYGVEIVPEIDMPGHFLSAISQYPNLSCGGKAVNVRNKWGIEKVIACASKDETFSFLTDIINEVAKIFPCQYFHIGGDEVPKDEWEKCPLCQKKIRELGLKNENELQGWFQNKIIEYLESKGKQTLIWDEQLGVSPVSKNTVLQLWRNELDRAQSFDWIEQGGKVLISYGKNFYFDYPYGKTSLKKTYSFIPKNIKLKEKDFDNILGQEAAVWTEWIRDKEKYEFMLYPRMQAFAENCWSENADNYSEFENRLKLHLEYLRANSVDYCPMNLCNPKGLAGLRQKIFAISRTSDTYGEIRMKRKMEGIK